MRAGWAASLLALGSWAWAGQPQPALEQRHHHPGGAFSFAVPGDWTVSDGPGDVTEARGGDLIVRLIWQKSEFGTDIAQTNCMAERPVPGFEGLPRISYEYDFVGGVVEGRRVLDSAFSLAFEAPVRGHRVWRERAVTVTGEGETLCAVSFAPKSAGKRGRRLLDAILASLSFPTRAKP